MKTGYYLKRLHLKLSCCRASTANSGHHLDNQRNKTQYKLMFSNGNHYSRSNSRLVDDTHPNSTKRIRAMVRNTEGENLNINNHASKSRASDCNKARY